MFDHLEKQMPSKISPVMRKILLINDVDCIGVIGRIDNVYIQRIESFMKDDLNADMLETGETLKDYLGVYSKCQKQFKFTPGQTIVLRQMVDLCKKFVHPDKNPGVPSSAGANGDDNNGDNSNKEVLKSVLSKAHHYNNLSRYLYNWIKNQNSFKHVSYKT